MEPSSNKQNSEMNSCAPYGFSSLESSDGTKQNETRIVWDSLDKFSMSESEAKNYYGDECCNLLSQIFECCREEDYTIYQHATNQESAENIMQKGFIVGKNLINSIPTGVLKGRPTAIEKGEYDGVRTFVYDGGRCEWMSYDALETGQHFSKNSACDLDYGQLTNPYINRNPYGSGATVLLAVSNRVQGSRDIIQYGAVEPHYGNWNDEEIGGTYFERIVTPREFCIGYLDVDNRRFVANPNFQFDYEVDHTFLAVSRLKQDLAVKLINNFSKKN